MVYKVSLKKPLYASLVNEAGQVFFPQDLETSIQFTSVSDHKTLGEGLGEPYEKELALDTHDELKKLTASVLAMEKGQEKGIVQINLLTSKLADRIRYMGDWRTVDGRFKPRAIKDVMQAGYGDCKDYATILCKCLRELGYKSNVALIVRGQFGFLQSDKLPSAYAYNHAITYVELPDGTPLFVDPTNFASMAQIIFPDIADRSSLILDGKNSRLLRTPDLKPHQNVVRKQFSVNSLTNKQNEKDIEILRIGIPSLGVTGIGLVQPRQMIIDGFIRSLSSDPDPKILDLYIPELTSRIVSPVRGTVKMLTANDFLRSSRGYGVFLGSGLIDSLFSIKNDQEGDIFLDLPQFSENIRIFKNMKDDHPEQQSIEIHSPWLSYIRTVTQVGNDLHIKEQQIIHEKMLTAKHYKSKLFADFKEKLREKVYQYIYIMNS